MLDIPVRQMILQLLLINYVTYVLYESEIISYRKHANNNDCLSTPRAIITGV